MGLAIKISLQNPLNLDHAISGLQRIIFFEKFQQIKNFGSGMKQNRECYWSIVIIIPGAGTGRGYQAGSVACWSAPAAPPSSRPKEHCLHDRHHCGFYG